MPFGVIVSSFLLHVVLQSHLRKEFESEPELLEKLLSSFYVDDLVFSKDSLEETFLPEPSMGCSQMKYTQLNYDNK